MFGRSRIRGLKSHRVRVITKDGHTIEGVTRGTYADAITLVAAIYLRGGDQPPEPLSGEVVIERGNVAFYVDVSLQAAIMPAVAEVAQRALVA